MKKYILPFLTLGLLASCVEDEGNYNYKHLNEVDIQDIEESYAPLAYMDNVTISPVLSGSLAGTDLSSYEYEWHICLDGHTNHMVISTEKDLDWPANIAPGTYTLYFVVKDRTTGLETQKSTNLIVGSPYLRGFMVLGDDMETGNVRLDMLCMPVGRDTAYAKSIVENPVGLVGAKQIIFSGTGSVKEGDEFLWLLSEHSSYMMSYGDTISFGSELNEAGLLEIETPHKTPMRIHEVFPRQGGYSPQTGSSFNRARTYKGMILDDMVVFCPNGNWGGAINRYSPTSNEYFTPYPKAFLHMSKSYNDDIVNTLIYDVDHQCFARITNRYPTYLEKIVNTSYVNEWDIEIGNDNRTLVYAENGFNVLNTNTPSTPVYMILKDNDADNYYIVFFGGYYSNLRFMYMIGQKSPLYKVDPAGAPDFGKASHYMFSSNRQVLLYSVGSRLYQYDYTRGTSISMDFDGEITDIEPEYASQASLKDYFVATYNEATGKGMIYKMEVPPTANAGFSFLQGQQWETDLRVKDIEWKLP